ncbi:phosphate ABC transporter, permease protein PstA [Rheinheimera salexigens]|uniref:Phosphate transport system permease protein PstA n=1 Tax=Rheinheimera salexigens TaxID=1628148 RepID=A0A1E7Q9S2_9GAMM|nr:phosphate ABC transporter, permease protein PstA [Rheinheimera salexigens]
MSAAQQQLQHQQAVQQKVQASLAKRHTKEKLFRRLGFSAVLISLGLVAILFINIFSKGLPAFWQSSITLDIYFDPAIVKVSDKPVKTATESEQAFQQRSMQWQTEVGFINFNRLITNSLKQVLPDANKHRRELSRVVTSGERYALRDLVLANPDIVGQTRRLHLLTDANIDVWLKGNIDRSLPDEQQQLSPVLQRWAEQLAKEGIIQNRFSFALFMNPDSRSSLASAGLAGAFMGSFYMLLVVILLAVPMGVAAAIYLEEFAPQNRFTDLVEVNINNLAAVPSIVFGLLGASVLIGWFNLPMSAPIVGGIVLSLMTLPTVIIATRSTLKAIPPSIRQAALGLGASKMQAVFHHVLPLAIPGILTGAILGVAQALGETAPLLLIGMKSFVASVPATPFEQSTALPVQIFLWQGNELRNFFEARTSAAIIVLLVMMLSLNGIAIFLRKKFQRNW